MIVDLANVGSVSSGRDEDCSIVARNEYQFHKLSACVLCGVDPRWTQVPGWTMIKTLGPEKADGVIVSVCQQSAGVRLGVRAGFLLVLFSIGEWGGSLADCKYSPGILQMGALVGDHVQKNVPQARYSNV